MGEERVMCPRERYIRHQLSALFAEMAELRPYDQRKACAAHERAPTSVRLQHGRYILTIMDTHLDSFPSPRHKSEQMCRASNQSIWDLYGHSWLDV